MCTEEVDGVLIVRDGARRLRWRHQIDRRPPPGHVDEWVIADVWPAQEDARQVHQRMAERRPVLVVLDHELPSVTLPVEHLPVVPPGATLRDRDDELVTVAVTELDWLDPVDRRRGEEFAVFARAFLQTTPRALLPRLILDPGAARVRSGVQFAHTTAGNPTTSTVLRAAVEHLFGTSSAVPSPRLPIAV